MKELLNETNILLRITDEDAGKVRKFTEFLDGFGFKNTGHEKNLQRFIESITKDDSDIPPPNLSIVLSNNYRGANYSYRYCALPVKTLRWMDEELEINTFVEVNSIEEFFNL